MNDKSSRCWAQVDLPALRTNCKLLKARAGRAELMAVVKANGYGHGDERTAHVLAGAGADRFAVACFAEAMRLREGGIRHPILILGYTHPEQAPLLAQHAIEQTVFGPEYARALSQQAVAAGVEIRTHFKVDTGMNRLGFDGSHGVADAVKGVRAAMRLPGLVPVGIFTHFASADSRRPEDVEFVRLQFRRFEEIRAALAGQGVPPLMAHCCNSAAMLERPEMHLDGVRPGIALFGYSPGDGIFMQGLRPALELRAAVAMVRDLHKGDTVSYGRAFTAPRAMRAAVLCAGYADGYPRLLSGQGVVGLHGRPAPVLGRVCMDQMVVDVSHIPQVRQGDAATLLGGHGADSMEEAAVKCGTVAYEMMCGISSRVPRVYDAPED